MHPRPLSSTVGTFFECSTYRIHIKSTHRASAGMCQCNTRPARRVTRRRSRPAPPGGWGSPACVRWPHWKGGHCFGMSGISQPRIPCEVGCLKREALIPTAQLCTACPGPSLRGPAGLRVPGVVCWGIHFQGYLESQCHRNDSSVSSKRSALNPAHTHMRCVATSARLFTRSTGCRPWKPSPRLARLRAEPFDICIASLVSNIGGPW